MENDGDENERRLVLERERRQIERIRELDFEELLVEEVDDEDDDDHHTDTGGSLEVEEEEEDTYNYNTSLASLHTYLGEVDDTTHSHRLSFLDSESTFTIPLFYTQGLVLFPQATLPLRVIQPNFIAALDKALLNNFTIAVVRVSHDYTNRVQRLATIGTTAEIRQYRRLEDGSINVVTRGQQRFRLRRHWFDGEGVTDNNVVSFKPFADIQIIKEDSPLRTPRDAFGKLGPVSNMPTRRLSMPSESASSCGYDDDSEVSSDDSFESELSPSERRLHRSLIQSRYQCDAMDESTSSDDDDDDHKKQIENSGLLVGKGVLPGGPSHKRQEQNRYKRKTDFDLSQLRKVPRAFLPYWVYRMYDSYSLAQRAADMWNQVVKTPSMEGLVNRPELLSFYIGSKIPVSESIRQELLEIDGISYRLQREIELLESFDRVRCKTCQTVIAKRSDMLVMSSDGPLGAYVNPGGHVHEIMTLLRANGLALVGRPVKEYSWFPGYAWTITTCATCEIQVGWLFSATNKKLKPRSFWGIRSSQVADETR
ncbi:hypothetical protein ACFE04_017620 [Oxalis oulophora]